MKIRLLSAGAIALSLSGCAGPPVKLYAHEGPLAVASPDMVIPAASAGQGNTGTLSFALPGATCNGNWERLTKATGAKGLMPDSGMITRHGGVQAMGENGRIHHGSSNAEIVGNGKCSDGRTFVWTTVANGYKARGALKDSNGNMFRIVLR